LNATTGFDATKWDDISNMTFTGVGYSDALTGDCKSIHLVQATRSLLTTVTGMNFLEPGQGINWVENHGNHQPSAAGWDVSNNRNSKDIMQETLVDVLDHGAFRTPYQQQETALLHVPPPTNVPSPRKRSVIIDVSKFVKCESSPARVV
jgi:hypothetical protein